MDTSGQWECPDFFPLPNPAKPGLYVLKGSTNGKEFWSTGNYDEQENVFVPVTGAIPTADQIYDYGAYYARWVTGQQALMLKRVLSIEHTGQ